ncbi:MAG: hypothetical protein ACPLSJ_01510 [Thermosulfidibacteraceae bacterium]|jgi:hypothetical protein
MSHLHLENIKPVKEFFEKLKRMFPAPWHHHEVRIIGRGNREFKIFIPEGRPDMLAVICEEMNIYEVFEDLDDVAKFLRDVVGLSEIPTYEKPIKHHHSEHVHKEHHSHH